MSMNDLLTICRLCLNIKTDSQDSLYFKKISNGILKLIMECTSVTIDIEDGYPNFICSLCTDSLERFNDFRTMCLKSDFILKGYNGALIKSDLENYIKAYKTSELQISPEICDEENFIKEESSIDDLDSSTDLKLIKEVHTDFTEDSVEKNLDNDELTTDVEDDQPLKEKPLRKSKRSARFKSQQKERIRLKRSKQSELQKKKKELRVCYICGKLTLSLTEHLITHKSVRDWECEKCGKMFSNRAAVRKHQYVHDQNKGHVCDKCGASFVTKHTLARHIRTVHFPTKPFECSICSRRFEYAYNLKIHKMKHSGEKPYKCKYCPENFMCKIKFREHNMEKHNVTLPLFKCEKCNLTFVYNFQLQAHKKTPEHEAGLIFDCTLCGDKFDKQRLYQKHLKLIHKLKSETKMKSVTKRLNKCEICNKTFKQHRYLKQHEKLHSENGKKFKCEVCGKAFLYNAFLQEHIRIHTGERPAKCDFCNNAYVSFRQLKKHIKSHN